MELIKRIKICNKIDEIPDFKSIKLLQRGVEWKILFSDKIKSKREKIGRQWKFEHPEFRIGIHTIEPEINIVKLITDKEIEENQDFFEQCAKDYRNLATKLINEFIDNYNLEINPKYPMDTLYHTEKLGYKPIGEINEWRYAFHGIHCAFSNLKTGQHIEVPLTYGLEFGELDPYFFTGFIKSTRKYKPLPVEIYCDYADGVRILEKMVKIGKFEYIDSNWSDKKGIVVTDREKVAFNNNSNVRLEQQFKSKNKSNTNETLKKIEGSFWIKLKKWL